MIYKIIKPDTYIGERALFNSKHCLIEDSIFKDGESPLKESSNLVIRRCRFEWKYPIWCSKDVIVEDTYLSDTARSGIWYTNHISIKDSIIDAPKTFRRCEDITLVNVKMNNASETLWKCDGVKIKDSYIKGDYFGFNSSNIELDNVTIDGNYAFDGGSNIVVRNCILNSKDSFWNCKNVKISNSKIVGEYLGWNTIDLEIVDCEIKSHQGLCYVKNLKIKNTKIVNSDLTFEFSEDIDADIDSEIDSIKNPTSGIIKCLGVKELVQEDKFTDRDKIKIVIK